MKLFNKYEAPCEIQNHYSNNFQRLSINLVQLYLQTPSQTKEKGKATVYIHVMNDFLKPIFHLKK